MNHWTYSFAPSRFFKEKPHFMNIPESRVKHLITLYFNQLIHGCRNVDCQNRNCASSARFAHPSITPNQAAALAIELTVNRADLCLPTSSSLSYTQMSGPSNSNSTEHGASNENSSGEKSAGNNESSSYSFQVASTSPTDNDQSTHPSVTHSDALATGSEEIEDSFRSLMTPAEVTRLIMFLFDASENDELNSSQLNEPASGIITEDYSTDHDNSLSSALHGRNPLFSTSRASSSGSHALKALKAPANQTNPTVSTSNISLERESRKMGLSLTELQKAIENNPQMMRIRLISNSSLCITSAKKLKHDNERTQPTLNNDDNDSFDNVIRSPSDINVIRNSTCCITDPIPMEQDDIDLDTQEVITLDPVKNINNSTDNVYWPPVNLNDLRQAWSLIVSIPERQNIVDTLMRAVRRLVVISLHQLLVIQPPDGLDDSQPTSEIAIIRQKLVNLFIILYECPFATDPLHFELLLLNINRAVTWLPISIQIMLCRAWANSVHIPLANRIQPPNPEQTNLWCLQKILLHHITLRCLTTDHGLPNEDKQICEAALVLRIVYYASLLAGQMDSPELLEMEAEDNRSFELEMRAYIGPTYERRSRTHLPEDPFAKALNISPNDCRKPFIPAKDFVNETLNDGLQPKKDYIYYRSKGISNELSFMKLPFLLQTSSKSVLLYYDNRMRMLDERRGVLMHTFFMDTPEVPFFKLRVNRDRIVEDALLILEIACLENPGDFKKQLLVEFEGEQGIDEGGLSKEFFQLIIERIFNPDYGMFVLDEETQNYWFNPVPIDDMEREYCLIGTLLGLAIYNDVILDINFPSVLYRKLVGKLGTFEDLFDARPSLANGLKALLEHKNDDIEEVFGCSFVVNYLDPFGNVVTHELKPNGAAIPVTKHNRKEYVDLYAGFY
ncbi:unnamed protein product [Heterobilharzia americana]|nr:unnamed protein product [Heterobilharzia americana]